MEDLCTIHPSVKSLMFRDIISLTVIFKISPLVGLFGVFRNCSLSIKTIALYNKDFIPYFNSFVSLLWIYICWSVRTYDVLEGSLKFNCLLDVFLKALNGLLIHMHSTHTHAHTRTHTHKRTNTNTNEFWKLISMISEETVRDDCINYCNVQLLKWFHLFCLFVTRA